MGCGASAAAATPEQKEKMCVVVCKNAMVSCVEHIINVEIIEKDSADLKVPAPGDEVKSLRDFVATLRKAAEDAKAKAAEVGADAEKAAADAGGKASGLLGGLGGAVAGAAAGAVGTVAGAAATAAGAVAGAAGSGTDAVLTGCADGIQGQLDALDAQFAAVGKELLSAKKKEILDIYNNIIAKCQFQSAHDLIRGADPNGYLDKSGDIARGFMAVSAAELEKAMMEQVGEEIKKVAVVKTWEASIEKFNAGNDALGKVDFLKDMKAEPIKLDLKVYIVKEVVKNLGTMMAKREDEVRKNPKGKAKEHQDTFEVVFSPEPLNINHWRAFNGQ